MLSHSTGHRSGQALQMTALWDCCRKRSSTRTMESSRRVDLISPSAALPQNERWLNRIANSGELAADRQLALAERACDPRPSLQDVLRSMPTLLARRWTRL